jgi:hypothetical protein
VHEDFGLSRKFAAAIAHFMRGGKPRAEQGLLISKRFYQMLGGHKDGARGQERLLARIGRRRIVTLRASVVIGERR